MLEVLKLEVYCVLFRGVLTTLQNIHHTIFGFTKRQLTFSMSFMVLCLFKQNFNKFKLNTWHKKVKIGCRDT